MTVRVSIRHNVMNLNAISTAAQCALCTIPLYCETANGLPLLIVRSHFTATPESTVFPLVELGSVQNGTPFTTAYFFITCKTLEWRRTKRAIARNSAFTAPTISSVALSRTKALSDLRLRDVELIAAMLTGFMFSVHSQIGTSRFQPFIPSNARNRVFASAAAIFTLLRRIRLEVFATVGAWFCDFVHVPILA